jgi:hypothetical protein
VIEVPHDAAMVGDQADSWTDPRYMCSYFTLRFDCNPPTLSALNSRLRLDHLQRRQRIGRVPPEPDRLVLASGRGRSRDLVERRLEDGSSSTGEWVPPFRYSRQIPGLTRGTCAATLRLNRIVLFSPRAAGEVATWSSVEPTLRVVKRRTEGPGEGGHEQVVGVESAAATTAAAAAEEESVGRTLSSIHTKQKSVFSRILTE